MNTLIIKYEFSSCCCEMVYRIYLNDIFIDSFKEEMDAQVKFESIKKEVKSTKYIRRETF